MRACSRVVSMSECMYVCVCLLSVWASEHGTERWLTLRQLSWQQRMSCCCARSQLSQNPTDSSLLSVLVLCSLFLLFTFFFSFVPKHPLSRLSSSSSFFYTSFSLPCCFLYPSLSTSCPTSLHSPIPSSPPPILSHSFFPLRL